MYNIGIGKFLGICIRIWVKYWNHPITNFYASLAKMGSIIYVNGFQ